MVDKKTIDALSGQIDCLIVSFLGSDEVLSEELKDSMNGLRHLIDDWDEFNKQSSVLADSIDANDRNGCAEALSMMRASVLNVEDTYSGLVDLISNVTGKIMVDIRLAAAKDYEAFGIKGLLVKNDQVAIGTFMDELHWEQSFNAIKFSRLCNLLSKYDGDDPMVLSLAFKLYSSVMKKISYHNNPVDGFVISNVGSENIPEIYEAIENLETIMQSLCSR